MEDSHFHTCTNPTTQKHVMQNTKAFGIQGLVMAALKNPDMDSVAPGDKVWTSISFEKETEIEKKKFLGYSKGSNERLSGKGKVNSEGFSLTLQEEIGWKEIKKLHFLLFRKKSILITKSAGDVITKSPASQ